MLRVNSFRWTRSLAVAVSAVIVLAAGGSRALANDNLPAEFTCPFGCEQAFDPFVHYCLEPGEGGDPVKYYCHNEPEGGSCRDDGHTCPGPFDDDVPTMAWAYQNNPAALASLMEESSRVLIAGERRSLVVMSVCDQAKAIALVPLSDDVFHDLIANDQ